MTFTDIWWLGLAVGGACLGLYVRNRPDRRLGAELSRARPILRRLGGLRWTTRLGLPLVASVPLVRIEGYSWGLRVARSFPPLGLVIPVWEARFAELDALPVSVTGVELRLRSGESSVTVLVSERDQLLHFLGENGAATGR